MLIGLAIPSSFLMGILALALMGYTINMIVLFSLILAVGMLVDDAIIVTEFAERRMSEGMPKGRRSNSRPSAWPVRSSPRR
jgi:multidrug efflux pump